MTEQRPAPRVAPEPPAPDIPRPRVIRIVDPLPGKGPGKSADTARLAAAEARFLRRCVGYLAADLGIRQFVDLGSRVPLAEGVGHIVLEHAPDARVVRVGTGTTVLPRGRASSSTAAVVRVDRLDTGALAAHLRMRGLVDLDRPAAVLLNTDLLPSGTVAHDVVRALHSALAPGSHLVLCQRPPNSADPHARELAAPLFDPFELLEPGLADLAWWPYPDDEVAGTGVGVLAGLARRR